MKLLLIFALLAFICLARSAPAPSPTPRLVYQDYHEAEEETASDAGRVNDDEPSVDVADEEDEETTTTTTTRRSPYIPTRNRDLFPTRRPFPSQRTTSVRTTTTTTSTSDSDDDQGDSTSDYDGDFKYIRDFRKYVQNLLEDVRKLVRKLTGYEFENPLARQRQRQQNNRRGGDADDDD